MLLAERTLKLSRAFGQHLGHHPSRSSLILNVNSHIPATSIKSFLSIPGQQLSTLSRNANSFCLASSSLGVAIRNFYTSPSLQLSSSDTGPDLASGERRRNILGSQKKKNEAEWKDTLSDAEFYVLRQKGTEPAHSGPLNKFYPSPGDGHFACAGCGNPLYSAASKFDSGCGWPAFDKCYEGSVRTEVDDSLFARRIEILCAACDGHLGHVFEGERFTTTNERHCVNSISIKFVRGVEPEGVAEESLCNKI